ncbi:MAG: DNA-binding protein [Actinomycetota bacterium]|nr:DNA-binding protein [Actinomycetota bacterium]
MTQPWTADDVRGLPVTVDLVTAGAVLGMGRTATYEAQRRGDFPVPVLRLGHRYRVVTAHLQRLLGLDSPR